MDPLSVTASIIAVVQLSSNVAKYIISVKAATREQRQLRNEVIRCHSLLLQIQDESDDTVYESDDMQWRSKVNVIQGPHSPLIRITSILSILDKKLKLQVGMKGFASLFKWPFTKAEVQDLTQAIAREIQLLQLAFTADCRELQRQILKSFKEYETLLRTVQSSMANFDEYDATTAKQATLSWIPAINFGARQSYLKSRRQDGTGQWFLESPELNTWLETKGGVLYCPGQPGAGKSTLTSILVDTLLIRNLNSSNGSHIGVSYIYFHHKTRDTWKIESLLSSLLKQLSQNVSPLPEELESLYQNHGQSSTIPSQNELLDALRSVVSRLSRSFVLVDAVDECSTSEGCRKQFVAHLLHLSNSAGINILATARDLPEVQQLFIGYKTLKIGAKDSDIEMFIDGHTWRLPDVVQETPQLQENIKAAIVKSSYGMFLLARLHLDSLDPEHILTVKDIHIALAKLPENYDFAYLKTMERIETQSPARVKLAKKTLSWIMLAQRPLTMSELREAVAIEPGDRRLEKESLVSIKTIVSVCAGLVTIDPKNGIVHLIHYTAQRYLENTKPAWFSGMESYVTKSLMSYITFSEFGTVFYDPDSGMMELDYNFPLSLALRRIAQDDSIEASKLNYAMYPLYAYAAKYWVLHARLGLPERLETSSPLLLRSQIVRGSLLWAARTGQEEIVQWLVEQGVDVNLRDATCKTPLHYAVVHEWDTCLQLLLDHGAQLVADIDNMSPLHLSVLHGKEALVSVFLNAGVSIDFAINRTIWVSVHEFGRQVYSPTSTGVNLQTKGRELNGLTSLHLAALMGCRRMVNFLLDKKANIHAISKHGETPLHLALKRDLIGVRQNEYRDCWNDSDYRLETAHDAIGFWPGSDDEWFEAQLYVESERFEIFRLLLNQSSINVGIQDECGNFPIHCLTYGRIPSVESTPGLGLTALWPHLTAAKYIFELLRRGTKMSSRNNVGQTPLHLACLEGDLFAVTSLLLCGSSPADRDADGRTALYYAVRRHHNGEIVRRLLDSMTDSKAAICISTKDRNGEDALHQLLGEGGCAELTILSLFLTYGVEVNDLDNAGFSPLAKYLSRHDICPDPSGERIVRLLFDCGANASVGGDENELNLAHLYAKGYYVNVKVLTALASFGVDLKEKDSLERTLLHHIAVAGSLTVDVLDYLCNDAGLSKESEDRHGRTALSHAADWREQRHPDCFDSQRWSRTVALLQE